MLSTVYEVTSNDRMFAGAWGHVDFDRGVGGGELWELMLEEEAGGEAVSQSKKRDAAEDLEPQRCILGRELYFMPFELPAQSQ